jgi:hypothetical protein
VGRRLTVRVLERILNTYLVRQCTDTLSILAHVAVWCRDKTREYWEMDLTDSTWEDYSYASRVSGAQQFVSVAFFLTPGLVDDVILSTVPWDRRFFTVTVGATTLPSG